MKAACIKAVCGCDLIAETFPARMERGVGLPRIDRVPYLPDLALGRPAPTRAVVLAGAPKPVTFFGYNRPARQPSRAPARRSSLWERDPMRSLRRVPGSIQTKLAQGRFSCSAEIQ